MPSSPSLINKILVLGLDRATTQLLDKFFTEDTNQRFELVRSNRLQDGLDYLRQNTTDIILLNLNTLSDKCLDAIAAIQKISTKVPIIVIAEAEERELAIAALRQGAQDCLFRSEITSSLLDKAISYAIERQKILQQLNQSKSNEKKLARQAKVNHILAQITQNIHSSLDLDIILSTAVENVHQFLSADIIFVAKIDERNKLNLLYESVLSDSPLCCNVSLEKEQKLLENSEILSQLGLGQGMIGNKHFSSQLQAGDLDVLEFNSILLIPIIAEKHLWGVVCGKKSDLDRNWIVEEIELLDRVAVQLGIAIQQSELYQKLEQLAIVDGLTQVANRRKFDDYINSEWQRLAREKADLSIILCDIDYFKLYNDTYGHQAGDLCLQRVAQAISKAIKRSADLVARYGGEEFAIILPHTNIEGAEYLARQICLQVKALHIPHINSSVDIYVTLSLGVAGGIPNNDSCPEALIAAADRGLYKAKELGRNRVITADSLDE